MLYICTLPYTTYHRDPVNIPFRSNDSLGARCWWGTPNSREDVWQEEIKRRKLLISPTNLRRNFAHIPRCPQVVCRTVRLGTRQFSYILKVFSRKAYSIVRIIICTYPSRDYHTAWPRCARIYT